MGRNTTDSFSCSFLIIKPSPIADGSVTPLQFSLMSTAGMESGNGDEPDPLEHYKSDGTDFVPEQPPIQKGLTHLNFLDRLSITLTVDGGPGCGGNIWIAGQVRTKHTFGISVNCLYRPIDRNRFYQSISSITTNHCMERASWNSVDISVSFLLSV